MRYQLKWPQPLNTTPRSETLESFHQRSTRIILARLFDKKFAANILNKIVDKRATFAKDILPWKPYFQIELMEIPKQMDTDLNSLADYFFSCSIKEIDKRNETLATATLETAIACVQKSIEMGAINSDEIEDQSLREEITVQKEQHLLVLRGKLREFYISLYDISRLFLTFSPLDKHMNEKLNTALKGHNDDNRNRHKRFPHSIIRDQ